MSVTVELSSDIAHAEESSTHTRRMLVGGVAGQTIEFYDYALYGLLAMHIGKHFFPASDSTAQLLSAFAVFGAAFVVRPIGGMLLGSLGDRVGRKAVLVLSVGLISVATFLVGVLPDVSMIGIAAPIVLVLLRLAQGFSAGGEASAVFAYVSEHAPANRRGLYTGWVQSGSAFSFLLGAIVIAAVNAALPQAAVDSWGWRIPFLLALPFGIVAVFIRLKLAESPVFVALIESGKQARSPLAESFRLSWRQMLQGTGIAAVVFVVNYTFLAYVPTFLNSLKYSRSEVSLATIIGLVVVVACHPLAGLLSDRFGRKRVAMIGMVLLIVLGWPLFAIMTTVSLFGVIVCLAAFGVLLCLVVGPPVCFMVEAVTARTRMSTFAFGYNVGSAIFGGTAVFVAQYLISTTGDSRAGSYYLIVASAISLAAIASVKRFAKPGESVAT